MDGKLEAGLLQLSAHSWADGKSWSRGDAAIWWGRGPHAAQKQEQEEGQEAATEVLANDQSRGYLEGPDGANCLPRRLCFVL